MPYEIELMSIGADVYPLLKKSADQLNGVQTEFKFRLTPVSQRQDGLLITRDQYQTADIWTFLRDQRDKFGGNRPHIIAFVTKPLSSPKYRNIFGSHQASEGLAVVTTFGTGQYVKEEARYCCYYLARYCLSFVNPSIKAHNELGREKCYFHQKIYKPDIRASMDAGVLCDDCSIQLQSRGSIARGPSAEEIVSLEKMRQHISGDLPQAIVMKGGGVKGLAFAGALLELEKYFWFDRHVGTSAGSIAAVLLAASYTPSELTSLLRDKEFSDFLDAPIWKVPFNLLVRKGCYPGKAFQNWISALLAYKITILGDIHMSDLNSALIYASRRGDGTIRFDSKGDRNDAIAAFAVRCSMSIPVFFQPTYVDERRVFDGGLRNNFPLARFLKDHPQSNFIALYLGKPDANSSPRMASELLDILIEGEERQTVDEHINNVVVVDTSPIGTIDFSLTSTEKRLLLSVGKAAALEFLFRRKLDDGPSEEEVEAAQAEAEELRTRVRMSRKTAEAKRLIWLLGIVAVLAAVHLFGVF